MKKMSKFFKFQKISLHRFFFHMFDLQLDQLPPLSSTHPFKESLLVFIKRMNGISENDETLWDQNDPQPCPQGDLNPGQYILAKKVMKKIKFRLKLYQLSYSAILHKVAKSYYTYWCQTAN